MVRRFHRSVYEELDELKAAMDYLFQLALDPADNPMVSQEEDPDCLFLYPHNLKTEVSEDDEDVIVTVDIVPGIDPSKISVRMISRSTLAITCERQEDPVAGDYQRNPRSVSLHQEIRLPCPVLLQGARTTLNHGVLDLHMKKMEPARA